MAARGRPRGPTAAVAAALSLALALLAAVPHAGQEPPPAAPAEIGEPADPAPAGEAPAEGPQDAAPRALPPIERPPLPDRFLAWLQEVEPLILSNERYVFLTLKTDYQRDAFIDRFWRVRDPYPKTARNELKVRYTERVLQARGLYRTLDDDRSRIFLVHGPPTGKVEVKCSASYKPVEVWLYDGSEQVAFSILLLFLVPRDGTPASLWHPEMSGGMNQIQSAARCINGEQAVAAATTIRSGGLDWELGFRRMLAKPLPSSQEWLATFQALSTELPPGAVTFPAELDLEFPARYQQRTVVQGLITVPREQAVAGDALGFRSFNFDLTGEIVLDDELFENFRYKFTFSEDEFAGEAIPLAFQRYLRPGGYRLIVKLTDTNGDQHFRVERDLEVPRVEGEYERPASQASQASRLFAEATAALERGETSIRIVPPRRALQKGFVRFDTLAVGEEIDKVAFLLDRKRVAAKTRPPWNVEIDLGEFPRPHTLRVEALDEAGTLLAWDELRLNVSSQAFGVRLVEPRRGIDYQESLLARAEVDVPEGRSLDRVEFFLNDRRVATLFQAPFAQPIALGAGRELTYVRAVAYLPDGTSAEDLVFINSPGQLEQLDIQVVELYTSVLDRSGRPVAGLELGDFRVLEDGVPQEVTKFTAVADQPIRVGILFDNSASMAPVLDAARIAALTFLQDAIGPRDEAAVITFNRLPKLKEGLTGNLRLLGGALAGLTAEGETALYDSIMFGLYYLAGVKGQRALLLLSDGKDEASRFSYEETLDYARRAGVGIYAVGLGLRDPGVRSRLQELADETGGRSFFIDDLRQLVPIYTLVQQELRSQYLLTYQSSNTSDDEVFRAIEVEVEGDGLTARTLSGYYP